MSDVAITIDNLSKAYRIGLREEIHDTLTKAMLSLATAPVRNVARLRRLNTFGHANGQRMMDEADIIWALRGVTFDVRRGEVVGIVGRNGAGKSTLLKILSRITDPTHGRALIRGRVASLLEVGTGFHPELTGRENVYMNGTILGMRKREIDLKFDEIVDFSGVDKFIDTPVKRYSSGMKVRLAFAVAAHLEPEILIIDEVLAVGDAAFQRRCLGKINAVANSGRTVLFVSHNMASVLSLCARAVCLSDGAVIAIGTPDDVIPGYVDHVDSGDTDVDLANHPNRRSRARVILRRLKLLDLDGRSIRSVPVGTDCMLDVLLENDTVTPSVGMIIHIGLSDYAGTRLVGLNSSTQYLESITLDRALRLRIVLRNIRLAPDAYWVSIRVGIKGETLDAVEPAFRLNVSEANVYGTGRTLPRQKAGLYWPEVEWHVVSDAAVAV